MASAVNALNALLRGTSIDDHVEVLKLANAAIAAAKGGSGSADRLAAQHTKVVALLKLDRFDDALRTVADGGDALAARCVLERAYALYKTGGLDAAAALSGAGAGASRGMQHLAAQVAYRAEQYDRAAALYAGLAEPSPAADTGSEATDLRINSLAVSAQRLWQGRGTSTDAAGQDAALDAGRRDDLELFETAYNAGCAAVARGDVSRASILLRRAQQLCEALDDLGDDDKRAELLPILVQQAYVLTRLGRHEDAAAVQTAINVDASQGAAKVVASTNAVAILGGGSSSSSSNPYLLQRQIAAIPGPPAGSDRLFSHQARILRHNQYAIELQCYKFKGVQARTAKQLQAAPREAAVLPETVDLGIFGGAAKAELQTGKPALRQILPLLEHRPEDVGLLLTAVQLQLQAKNTEAALVLLESFFQRAEQEAANANARFAPGLVALAVALYKLQGRHSAVRAELAKAVAHWQGQATGDDTTAAPQPATLLRAAGVELLQSPNPADQAAAAAAFETLHAADPADRIAVAGLVASLAAESSSSLETPAAAVPPRLSQLAASLTPVDQLVKGVDVASLLQSGVAAPPAPVVTAAVASKKRAAASGDSPAAADGQQQPSAKKAKTGKGAQSHKENQPPKLSRQARKLQAKSADGSFDPAKKLDPERWLPLRDRSSYRPPKGKKGRRRGGEAATMQGGVVKEEETLALAGGAGSVRIEKAPLGAGGSGGAKKRKKGKK